MMRYGPNCPSPQERRRRSGWIARLTGSARESVTGDMSPNGRRSVKPVLRAVGVEQRLDFTTQRVVATDGGSQERGALGWRPFDRRLKQRLDLVPARGRHGRSLRAEFTRQPCLGGAPLALRRRGRDLQHECRLFDGEPAKRAEFHDLREAVIDGFQALERIDPARARISRRVPAVSTASSSDTHWTPSPALARVVATGVVDEDPPHDLCGDAKKMGPIPPIDMALIDEAQIRFVDERRRLQSMAHPLMTKLAPRDPAQLGIHQRQQLIESTVIPAAPIIEQRRDIRRRGHHYLLQRAERQEDRAQPLQWQAFRLTVVDPIVLSLARSQTKGANHAPGGTSMRSKACWSAVLALFFCGDLAPHRRAGARGPGQCCVLQRARRQQ